MGELTPEKQRFLLAVIAILFLVGCVWALAFFPIQPGIKDALIAIVSSAVVAPVKDIYGFYFGSSQGSKDKDATIAAAKDGAS